MKPCDNKPLSLLAYSDWLEEHGQLAWAEDIREDLGLREKPMAEIGKTYYFRQLDAGNEVDRIIGRVVEVLGRNSVVLEDAYLLAGQVMDFDWDTFFLQGIIPPSIRTFRYPGGVEVHGYTRAVPWQGKLP